MYLSKIRKSKFQTYINIICSVLLLVVNLAINFFLSPFIVSNIGVEAHGFVTLANNFVTYANLIVQALNSMAARFISIAYQKKDFNKANIYYNSVFWGNLLVILFLLLPAVVIIIYLQNILTIPSDLMWDVKILFSIVFLTFFFQTGMSCFTVGTYVKNRLDREYIPNLLTVILKGLVLLLMFIFLTPHVWYVGMGSFIAAVALLITQFYNTKKLTPELNLFMKREKRIFSFAAMRELIGSGLWNSVSNLGVILFNGLDLIICNVFLGPIEMGILSIAKTLPNVSDQLRTSISRVFLPQLTIDFAHEDFDGMERKISNSMQLTSFVMVTATVGIMIMSGEFYRLWMPEQDYMQLQILVILSLLSYFFSNGISVLYSVFSVVNAVRQNALMVLGSGIVSLVITALVIKFTNFGIYAICGVSSLVGILKNCLFVIPYSAVCIKKKWYVFFKNVLRSTLACVILTGLGFLVYYFMPKAGWGLFICTVLIICALGLIISWFVVLNKESRQRVIAIVKNKAFKRKK